MLSTRNYSNFYKQYCSYDIKLEEIDLLRVMEICLKFQSSMRQISQPRIAIESLLLKLSYLDSSIDINTFFSKVKKNSYNGVLDSTILEHNKMRNE